jgi:hypothetical protein
MSAVNGNLDVKLLLNYVASLDLSSPTDLLGYSKRISFAPGTGANQASLLWHDQRTLAASATETLDLSGSLLDAFGVAVAFTKVRAILVYAAAANTNDVVVGGAAATQWAAPFGDVTDKVNVKPGGLFLLTAPDANGMAVANGATDSLKIANGSSGTGVTYDILIIGS